MESIQELIKFTKNMVLLYVEDNVSTRESTVEFLDNLFKNIIQAEDGKEGLELFHRHKIDLIISDVNMPKLSGIEMSKSIREIDQNIPILMFSAHNEQQYLTQTNELGVNGYLLKPLDVEQFLEKLWKIVLEL